MDLDEGSLKLIDTETFAILNSQPIHTIRVWGVGRDNGRLVGSSHKKILYFQTKISYLDYSHAFEKWKTGKGIVFFLAVACKQHEIPS